MSFQLKIPPKKNKTKFFFFKHKKVPDTFTRNPRGGEKEGFRFALRALAREPAPLSHRKQKNQQQKKSLSASLRKKNECDGGLFGEQGKDVSEVKTSRSGGKHEFGTGAGRPAAHGDTAALWQRARVRGSACAKRSRSCSGETKLLFCLYGNHIKNGFSSFFRIYILGMNRFFPILLKKRPDLQLNERE